MESPSEVSVPEAIHARSGAEIEMSEIDFRAPDTSAQTPGAPESTQIPG